MSEDERIREDDSALSQHHKRICIPTPIGGKRGGSWEETSQKVLWLAESF